MIDASRELNNKRAKRSRELGSTTAAKSWEALKTSHRVHEIIPPFDVLKIKFFERRKDVLRKAMEKSEAASAKKSDDELKQEEVNRLSAFLSDIANSHVGKESELQTLVMEKLAKFVVNPSERELVDTSTDTYLVGHKPDLSLKKTVDSLSPITVQAIGKLKLGKNSFNNSHFGEALLFLRLLLESQPWRESATCLLMDEAEVATLRMKRSFEQTVHDGAKCFVSSYEKLTSDRAVYLIDDFLNETEFIESQVPQTFMLDGKTKAYDRRFNTVQVLATSSNGAVYRCQFEDESANVVKLIYDENSYTNEKVITQNNGDVTLLLKGFNDEKQALLYPFLGDSLAMEKLLINRKHFAGLVDQVKKLHDRGILHRDIRPSNIVSEVVIADSEQNGTLRLIDFGLAVVVDDGSNTYYSTYVGSPMYSPQEHLLNPFGELLYGPSTDLESLVKTWASVMLSFPAKQKLIIDGQIDLYDIGDVENGFQKLAQGWSELFESFTVLGRAFESATRQNYEELKHCFLNTPVFFPA